MSGGAGTDVFIGGAFDRASGISGKHGMYAFEPFKYCFSTPKTSSG
jgi:hypothetical protein